MRTKADVLLHPVRLRILQRLVGGVMTAHELAEALPDVPHATLYRHLGRLAHEGIITVVSERRVRGAIERTYSVTIAQTMMSEEEVRKLGPDDVMRFLMSFLASVIDGFQRYVDQGEIDMIADGVSLSQVTVFLDDEELRQLRAESAAITMRAMALGPGPGRRARIISGIVVPEPLAVRPAETKEDAD